MPEIIQLFGGRTNLREAIASDDNVVVQHQHHQGLVQLWVHAREHRKALEQLVAFHVGVDVARIKTGEPKDWRRGTFNMVIPMLVFDNDVGETFDNDAGKTEAYRVLLRFPMPFKCGEAQNQGSMLEKLRCEAASYVWMQRHCPDVRIPHLYGFGFPNGPHFSFIGGLSIVRRAVLYVRKYIASWLGYPIPSNYLPVFAPEMPLGTGYMIIEHFDESTYGKQLALVARETQIRDQPNKIRNLYCGVSRIMLALARVPQPRIGAFRFYDDGTIRLDGRPVSSNIGILESEGAPRTIPVDKTYTSVDQYVADLSTFYETQFGAAPHAAFNMPDCEAQMSIMVFLRAVAHHFIEPDRRNGPFFMFMSDTNPGNLMVDDEWNVTGMFDLEWMFSAPPAMLSPPMWLTWDSIDHVARSGYDDYDKAQQAFIKIFKEEEQQTDMREATAALGGTSLSTAMEANWSSGRVWFHLSLMTVNAMTHITKARVRPLFVSEELPHSYLSRLWHKGAQEVVAQKLQDRQDYEADVKSLFKDTGE